MTAARALALGGFVAVLVVLAKQPPAGPPPVAGPLAAAARAALRDADPADRADLAAMAAAMARLVERDGRAAAPRLPSTHAMAETWVELQRIHRGSDAPFGDRYPAFEELLAATFPELETSLSAEVRADCVGKWQAIAEGLR